jgi:hypothetical protein
MFALPCQRDSPHLRTYDSQHPSCRLLPLCYFSRTTLAAPLHPHDWPTIFPDFTARPCPSHASLHNFSKLTSPRLWFWRASPVLDWDTPQKIIVLPFYWGLQQSLYQKTCVGTCTNFQRKTVQTRKKRDKKGKFLSFYFYTLLLGITT